MRVAQVGTFDIANYGDLLLARVARTRLGGSLEELLLVSPRGGPPVWDDCLPSVSIERLHDLAPELDGILLGGGNIIHSAPWNVDHYDTGGLTGVLAYPRLWVEAARVAAEHRIPLCWNAPGVPIAPTSAGARLLTWAAEASTYLSVRDRRSAALLADAGVSAPIDVVPDPGIDVGRCWDAASLDEAHAAAFASRGREPAERTIVIHLNSRYAGEPPDELAARLDRLCSRVDAAPVLVGLGPCHGDVAFQRAVAVDMASRPLVLDPHGLREVTAVIARADLYVGSSLHGMITACAFGVRGMVVALQEAQHKFSGFLEQFQLDSWRVDTWREAEARAEALAAAPSSPWSRVGPVATTQLDGHWDAIGAAFGTAASPTGAARTLDEVDVTPLSGGMSHPAYASLLPDVVRQLGPRGPRGSTSRPHEAPARADSRPRSDDPRRMERERALGRALRERGAFAGRAREAERRAAALERHLEAARERLSRVEFDQRGLADELRREWRRRHAAEHAAEELERSLAERTEEEAALDDRVDRAERETSVVTERLSRAQEEGRSLGEELAEARARNEELAQAAGRAAARTDALADEVARLRRPTPAVASSEPSAAKRTKVSVLAWDMGHNPLGRAHLLADMLATRYEVELIGPQFERYGHDVWEPLRHSRVVMRTFPGENFPDHFRTLDEVAREIDGDVVVACKPRLPSFGLAMLTKAFRNRPLLLDVDDRELSFVGATTGITLGQLRQRTDDEDFLLPFGQAWTQVCDSLVQHADHLVVSNAALRSVYGGTVVPHARDERVFDPLLYDRDALRARFGFTPDDKLILFVGTPRGHKGLQEVASALRQIGDRRLKLVVVGTVTDPGLRKLLEAFGNWLRLLPNQPFEDLPATLTMGDLVCVLQDPLNPISRHQIPAKVTDALAMGVPCLATRTPPLESLVERGAIEVLGDVPLHERISELLADPGALRQNAALRRRVFLDELSYTAVRPVLEDAVERLLEKSPPLPREFAELIDFQRDVFGTPTLGGAGTSKSSVPTRAAPPAASNGAAPDAPAPTSRPLKSRRPRRIMTPTDDGYDVVMFWKQNDSGIYGRRPDMFARYLARSPRINRVVHFDHPIDLAQLLAHRDASEHAHQGKAIFRQTVARVAGLKRAPKTSFHTFLHRPEDPKVGGRAARLLPTKDEWPGYVARTLAREGIGARTTVFWVYPRNFEFPELADAFAPEIVVADVTDDHRTWVDPNSSYHERLANNYREVLARSDVVLANCEPVQERMLEYAETIHVVPNACEPTRASGGRRRPRELARIPAPLLGYVGNLSSRIDVDLLDHIARTRPAWNIVLIGSAHLSRDILRLDEYPNVHFLGVQPYERARQLIRHFDVALIPHLDNEMTRTMNPLKAFAYCAEDVPVVSTDIANFGELRELIRVARGRNEFVAAIEHELAAGRREARTPEADRVLRRNCWDERVRRVVELLDEERNRTVAVK